MKKGHAYLLSIISDGKTHSGEALAAQLDISRAAIWKSIQYLRSLGLHIEAIPGKGYQLEHAIELLSENKIKKLLSSQASESCQSIQVLFKTQSTNTYLFNRLQYEIIHGEVVLAEYQSEGRGRRGNKWLCPVASGIMMSIGWRFDIEPKELNLLSLYIGIAIARTLQAQTLTHVGLKWPNDVMVMNQKIGGVLVEVRSEASGPVDVVIGIGINYCLSDKIKIDIEQPVTDICSHTEKRLSRNTLIATLLSNIFAILEDLQANKTLNLLDEWRRLDCCVGKQARLLLPHEEIEGVLKGVDNQGALLMSVKGKMKSYNSGEISLRVSS